MIVDVSENVEGERDVSAAATCGEKSSFLGNKMFRGSERPIVLLAEGGDGAQPALPRAPPRAAVPPYIALKPRT